MSQDRQIKPIYDAIDNGQYKSALNTCAKLLKKNPKNDLVKALKALVLVRSGKLDEGMQLADQLVATEPTDDNILSAMTHVLRALTRHDDLALLFETAFKRQPKNGEYAAQAFMANVRLGNWKAAQLLATKLHKLLKDDRYVYWNVMCITLQSNEPATTPTTQLLLRKLGLRLIDTCSTPSSYSADRFYLHLSLLRDLGMYDEAMALLQSETGRQLCDTSLSLEDLRYGIAILKGEVESELDEARRRLVDNRDRNWLTFMKLIECTITRITHTGVLDESRKLLDRLAVEDGTSERGPLLALLELERKVVEGNYVNAPPPPQTYVSLLKRYLTTFGDKASCYEDLKLSTFFTPPSSSSSSPEAESTSTSAAAAAADADADAASQRTEWRTFLDTRDLSNASSSKPELIRQINVFKLRRWDLHPEDITVESESERVGMYLRAYIDGLPLGKGLPKTELQPSDDLATLSASAYITLYHLTSSQSYLSCATTLLEYALLHSPHAFQHRLLLVRLYRLLGAPGMAMEHYKKLGVKQIQNDTMSHYVLSRCYTFNLGCGGDMGYLQECIESSQIYTDNNSETPDMVIKAFQFEKYTQIEEFITLEDRIDGSIQRDLTKMEHVRMRLTHEVVTVNLVDTELIEMKFMLERPAPQCDNRDFLTMADYQPKGQSLNLQTSMGGMEPGVHWWSAWMKMYTLVFQLASDIDPKLDADVLFAEKFKALYPFLADRTALDERLRVILPEEIAELTESERLLRNFVVATAIWLEPHHQYSRPVVPKQLPDTVAPLVASQGASGSTAGSTAKQNSTKGASATNSPPGSAVASGENGVVVKDGAVVSPPATPASASSTAATEQPVYAEPVEEIMKFFDVMEAEFKQASETDPPWKSLHVATLLQEAVLLFNILTARFRLGGGSKVKKGDPLLHTIKVIREKGIDALRRVGAELVSQGEKEGSQESRRKFTDECRALREIVPEILPDFVLDVAHKTTQARKKMREALGKGFERLCKAHANGINLASLPPGVGGAASS